MFVIGGGQSSGIMLLAGVVNHWQFRRTTSQFSFDWLNTGGTQYLGGSFNQVDFPEVVFVGIDMGIANASPRVRIWQGSTLVVTDTTVSGTPTWVPEAGSFASATDPTRFFRLGTVSGTVGGEIVHHHFMRFPRILTDAERTALTKSIHGHELLP